MRHTRQQGVALVVTLILLSVITFTAITFLVLSRREKEAAATSTDQTIAKLAAETGLERIQGELLSSIIATGNKFNYDLKVTTNYFNPLGFVSGDSSLTNVNYAFKEDGSVFTADDLTENIANLFYNPRPPVYIVTNRSLPRNTEFRFYLDLNRNGRFDPNGRQPVVGQTGNYLDTNGMDTSVLYPQPPPPNALSNFMVGDPEWIGILERPDEPHSASNRFVARYATVVVPSGKTLDINRAHNQAFAASSTTGFGELFRRNMGVGTWEANLASFLVDLNTNFWTAPDDAFGLRPYLYDPLAANPAVTGFAFDDANALIEYRYDRDYRSLRSVPDLLGVVGANDFVFDFIDGYGAGPFMTNVWTLAPDPDSPGLFRQAGLPFWPGDENPQHFFSPDDLFDLKKTAVGRPADNNFSYRLREAGLQNSTYDRYTFYRLLSQLGTDGGSENGDRININYDNKVWRNAKGVASVTNFVPWRPVDFFVETADNLFREYHYDHFRRALNPRFGPGYAGQNNLAMNIPVMTNGVFVYTPSIHRMLQLAANIYDATTNRTVTGSQIAFPTVFRPLVEADGNDLFITGWVEVDASNGPNLRRLPMMDPFNPNQRPNIDAGDNVYGVPWIIGAKKGFPNFNELSVETIFELTRKLELGRPDLKSRPTQTNQMYLVSINSDVGVEAWNSYRDAFSRPVAVYATNQLDVIAYLTNRPSGTWTANGWSNSPVGRAVTIPSWTGTGWGGVPAGDPERASFFVPIRTNLFVITNAIFRADGRLETRLSPGFDLTSQNVFPVPDITVAYTNRMQLVMVDVGTGRVLDYVHLRLGGKTNLTAMITRTTRRDSLDDERARLWETNRIGADVISAPTRGVLRQILVSAGLARVNGNDWRNYGFGQAAGNIREKEQQKFLQFLNGQGTNLLMQAPFTPSRRISQYESWQANDPLVHYLAGDLAKLDDGDGVQELPLTTRPQTLKNIGRLNTRYQPWGGSPKSEVQSGELGRRRTDLRFKDPLIRSSDNWQFPTNKFPNVGWLGRVHRGTPWQTVYMKASELQGTPRDNRELRRWTANINRAPRDVRDWSDWTGNDYVPDLLLTLPQEDFRLFDLMTAALSDTATMGQMSVNQDGLAAWSAILGGVIALTNTTPDFNWENYSPSVVITNRPVVIPPAGVGRTNSAVWRIVQGINSDRNRERNRAYQHAGDILKAEELTVNSPMLNVSRIQRENGITDPMYERIPQQIMGLLRGNEQPRFVVYSYGQSLKPAQRSLVTSGPYFGLCTNYQITAEVATRAVVQVENAEGDPRVKVESFNQLPAD